MTSGEGSLETLDRCRRDLVQLLGPERVRWDEETLDAHAQDYWPLTLIRRHAGRPGERPACVVTPSCTDEVSKVLAYANERRLPVVPFGGGSGVCGGVLPPATAIVVDLRGMAGLLELNEIALTARVQAGKMGDALEQELSARGYSTGHFPQSIALSTVGGWIATRAAGQFSTRYGNAEDLLLGLEGVLPDGRVVRINAVPRRSAGPDLRHVFLGSEGTLGIVTEVTVRVFPLPERRKLMCFGFPDFDAGLEAARLVVRAGWRPPVLRLYDPTETARHFGQWAEENDCFLLAVSEGSVELTTAEAEGCQQACAAMGGQLIGDQPVQHWLRERNRVPDLHSLVEKGFVFDTIEVAAGWDRIHDLYREVVAALREVEDVVVASGHSSHTYLHGTNIYFTFVARPEKGEEAESRYLECWERAMEATLHCGGSIAHHHGIGRVRRRWMEAEHGAGLEVLRALKRALDPNGFMNPGVLFPD